MRIYSPTLLCRKNIFHLRSSMKTYLSNLAEIYCKSGILRIEKIYPNAIVVNGKNKESKIKSNQSVDKIKFFNLSLKNGSTIALGENTVVITTEGAKKVQDISPNDYILHKFSKIDSSEGGAPINWEYILGANAVPIKVPKKMTKDLALWLGIISSKGRYYEENGYVAISLSDKVMGRLLHELTLKLFKIKPKAYEDKKTGYTQHYIISRNLVRFLKAFLGVNSNLKKVPQQLLEGSLQEQVAFLQGLTLDGYIEQGCLVVYGGISKRLADFAAIVLRSCGHSVYQQIRKSGQGNNVYYTKIISSHEDCMDVIALEPKKTEGLEAGGFLAKVTKEILETKIPVNDPGYSAHRNLKARGSKTCYSYTLDQLKISFPKDDYYVMVKEITTESQPGFCVETDEDGILYQGIVLGRAED